MALKRFTNGDKLKADQINYDENISILDAIFPIGRGFIDFTDTDYSSYLGFTWERELVGLVPVGLDTTQEEFNTIGKTGGEKTHKLTVNEMPNHSHPGYWVKVAPSGSGYAAAPSDSYAGLTGDTIYTARSIGGGQPHNNMPPYGVVAYWKRTS